MPYEVLYALEDALRIRRQYHAWYSNQFSQGFSEGNKEIKQSNEAHQAFIDVLQCIHDLFAPTKTSSDQAKPSKSSEEKILEVTNLFAKLEAEAEAEEEACVPVVNVSSNFEPAVKPQVARRNKMFDEDKIMELYCLYDDANKIRDYLRQKWAEYASRKIDLKSAALTTQAALEMFSEIEECFDEKHGKYLADQPEIAFVKYFDIFSHLAIGEPQFSTCTKESWNSKTAAEKEDAKLRTRALNEDRKRRAMESEWESSEELDNWVMRPAHHAIHKIIHKGDDWVLKQACRKTAARAGDLDALADDNRLRPALLSATREFMETFIDVYAGIVFAKHNLGAFIGPYDIITFLWLKGYDCNIRMILSMQILHDIRTTRAEPGQLEILTQASEDYKKLGADVALFSKFPGQASVEAEFLKEQVEKEQSWLEGRIPGHIKEPGKKRQKQSQRSSELLLLMNPVLAGIVLFDLSYERYRGRMSAVNKNWFLIPCAHLVNWLTVSGRKAKADFQKVWPDLHTALGMIGPRSIWVGSGQPEDSRTCRNRMFLAWGLPLVEFYRRMTGGDIPKAEELFSRIKYNGSSQPKLSEQLFKGLLSGKTEPSDFLKEMKPNSRTNPLLMIDTSQPTPILHAVYENLHAAALMNAEQSHIRNAVSTSTAAKASGSKRRTREEPDMMSYLDAFSRAAQAEMPRLLFRYEDLSNQCCSLSCKLFGIARSTLSLSADIWASDTLKEFERMTKMDPEKLGSGAQSVSSLLALAVMFGGRTSPRPVEPLMLRFIEDQWDKEGVFPPRNTLTKRFVEKCKALGFAVPDCATEALSSKEPAKHLT